MTDAGVSKKFEGVWTALATPFLNGEIDWPSVKKLIRFQLDGGVHGIVICGTTAESPTLTSDEKKQLFAYAKSEVAGAVPLVMGTGSYSTAETVHATRQARDWGAAAALVVVPYYNKPSQSGLFLHFQAVAQEGGLPVILYNVPSRTIARLELATIQRLAMVPGVVAIKEASGDIEFGRQIAKSTKLVLASGDDATFLRLAGAGGNGVISVISHLIPRAAIELLARARGGNADGAANEFDQKYGALNTSLYFEANPIPLKYALFKMGLVTSPELRLPLTSLDQSFHSRVDTDLRKAGLL